MKFHSTNNIERKRYGLKESVLAGLAPDGGLFMPDKLPQMNSSFFEDINTKTFQEISFEVVKTLMGEDVPEDVLKKIVEESFNFEVPLKKLDEGVHVLELYHGPTFAFKDFAARFMAREMSYFLKDSKKETTILVATSGDTGSAVASAFFEVPNIKVIILYPSGQVSDLQEKQLTTYGSNISALEIKGTFDDCQRLAKTAFMDKDINTIYTLGSANSINIMRLLPQTLYYFYAYAQLKAQGITNNIVFSVPSGNFGNLVAGVIAKKMGLPITRFIVSGNVNNHLNSFLKTGTFVPETSRQTISNAMDVGNPSNFARLLELYDRDPETMGKDLTNYVFTDDETKQAIKEVYDKYGYVMDPHGAVGYLGLKKFQQEFNAPSNGIFIETAHPVKFREIIEPIINRSIEMPTELEEFLKREKESTLLSANFDDFKKYMLEKNSK